VAPHHRPNGDFDLPGRISRDAELLADETALEVKAFSFHNPAGRKDYGVDVPGLVNAYGLAYFEDIAYVSESNMRWRGQSPDRLLKEEGEPAYQVLIHPLTYEADLRDDKDVLLHFLYHKTRELKDFNESENATLAASPLPLKAVAEYMLGRVEDE
jgi:hypothetical protein